MTLTVDGMTCASCAHESRGNSTGSTGSPRASTSPPSKRRSSTAEVTPEELVATVEATGYTARLQSRRLLGEADEASPRRRRFWCPGLCVPVLVLSMVPALQFEYWQWVSLALASPVVIWGAWPFHRAAWANLRHGNATMDTLISMGVAAYLWSVDALFAHAVAGHEDVVRPVADGRGRHLISRSPRG